ncbi:MAG: ribosome small subunit-dependent GTPase A [Gammaproteobacteria bacterium]|nr:ribosome small subunit-dependent GTPase A [Gammaproteobacteria bacterium]MBV9695972.1 ribosome small subunit-dependent GTPase A [Gammaproteobacteria bacterium]
MGGILDGRVIATFGRRQLVQASDGTIEAARPGKRALEIVCGDEVRCRRDAHHRELHVLEVLPRRSVLYRSNVRGEAEPVLANLTRLLVVLAPLPLPDLFLIDRYLAAAHSAGIAAALLLNKSELGVGPALQAELAAYAAIGYEALPCSAASGAGLAALRALLLPGELAALVGQSGVGKSSLVRTLLPAEQIEIGALVREEEGRHTTTAARRYELPGGAGLIDSPGVRDYAPAVGALEARTLGFIEVERLAPGCRFADCRHMREPDCAVRAAAGSGGLHPRRYESYRRLRRLREALEARRPRRGRPRD